MKATKKTTTKPTTTKPTTTKPTTTKATKKTKKTMTFRAVRARLARSLAHENLYLRTCRENSRWYSNNGRHFVVDGNNFIQSQHIDIEAWAREAGVIGPEVVVGPEFPEQ